MKGQHLIRSLGSVTARRIPRRSRTDLQRPLEGYVSSVRSWPASTDSAQTQRRLSRLSKVERTTLGRTGLGAPLRRLPPLQAVGGRRRQQRQQ
jgi:hypothetical protein